MRKAIIIILSVLFLGVVAGAYCLGRNSAFDDIILEKCWLSKSNDIVCIERIR